MGQRDFLKALLFAVCAFAFCFRATAQTAAPATTMASETVVAAGQQPERAPQKIRRPSTPPARVTVIPSEPQPAPQVVTVVHRLSGVKVLRLFLRQSGESGVVETIDPEAIMNDAHASIIAGWALEDGKTIAVRLPQAFAEIENIEIESFNPEQKATVAATTPFPYARARVEPDLTVITGDGRKLRARLVGLDAETGLSVLQVTGLAGLPSKIVAPNLNAGASVQIFAPQPAPLGTESSTRVTYVKVGKTDATVASVSQSLAGAPEELLLRAPKFSPVDVGGVVCDGSGNTIGIVESIDGNIARIVSATTIRSATQRVLQRQASVPRPLLGVRGEPVELALREAFLANGWHEDQLNDLLKAKMGILLTNVVPRTPAAFAKLQPGDVILRVNQNEVRTAEEFSKLLGEAGGGEQVQFTIQRPDAPAPMSVPVTLGSSFAPMPDWQLMLPRIPAPVFGLREWGIETMALTPQAASKLGAQRGLIVVAVEPASAGARSGLREGDVIESIDGRIATRAIWMTPSVPQKKHTLSVVRNGEKKTIVVEVEQ
jgi:S1-C subfamily serine protease